MTKSVLSTNRARVVCLQSMLYWWWRTLNCLRCRRFMTDVTHPEHLWLSIARAQHWALNHWALPITIFLPLDQTLSQFDAVHTHTAHFCKIHLSVIIPFPFWIFKMATFKEVFASEIRKLGKTISFSLRSTNILRVSNNTQCSFFLEGLRLNSWSGYQ